MGHAQAMLDTHPNGAAAAVAELGGVIETLIDCANTCLQCADACLGESNSHDLTRCIRSNLDCSDVCATTSRLVSRQTELDRAVLGPMLEACVAACRACGEECDRHAGHMEHCRICAEQCHRCEQACRNLLESLR